MDMASNAISHHGLHRIVMLLKIGCVNYLNLSNNNVQSEQDTTHSSYAAFAEQVKNNTTLRKLQQKGCGLTPQSVESLAEALTTNKYLEVLDTSDNALCDDGIQHLAHALRVNQGLKILWLNSCGMTDVGLNLLAKSLQHNKILTKLYVYNNNLKNSNRLTEKIVPVLIECLSQHKHSLTKLYLPVNLESSTVASIAKAVNDVRKRRRLPLIKVTGMSVPLNKNSLTDMLNSIYTVVLTIHP